MNSSDTDDFLETVFRGTSEIEREVIYLRYHSSYLMVDIAEILDISTAKLQRHCRRGLKKIMKNVLTALPIQKVSLDDILKVDFMQVQADQCSGVCDFAQVFDESLVSEDTPQSGQGKHFHLWFDVA